MLQRQKSDDKKPEVKALADDEVVRCEECRRILIRV